MYFFNSILHTVSSLVGCRIIPQDPVYALAIDSYFLQHYYKKEEISDENGPKISIPNYQADPAWKRRRKKEPLKPWTKKERIFVFIVLIFTTALSGFLALSARAWKLPGLPRLTLPRISSINIFDSKPVIFESENASINNNINIAGKKVLLEFESIIENLTGVYGLYLIDLNTGLAFGKNNNETFTAASLIKLPVMAAMYQMAENGNLNLEDKYTLKENDKTGGSGSLSGKPAGYTLTYRDLIRLMGKQSDNTAFTITKNIVGKDGFQKILNQAGLTSTDLAANETTPQDIGRFFEELWKGNLINQSNREEMFGFLTDTIYEDWLTKGLPENVKIAHKFGRETHVVNDAGIVFTTKPYAVVILTKGIIEKQANEVFPKLSELIYTNFAAKTNN